MNKERIATMKAILKKENGEYLYKQNRTSSFNTYLETLNSTYYAIHKRNTLLFAGLVKSISDEVKERVAKSPKLHIIFITEPMDVDKSIIYNRHVTKRNININKESVILIDVLPGRRGELPKDNSVINYWSMRDIANEYASIMLYIYHIITDIHQVVQIHTDSTVFDGEVIIDFHSGLFLTKLFTPLFKTDFSNKFDWPHVRTVLNDRFVGVDSLDSDPLASSGVFQACADDMFLFLRVTIVDKYTKYLRQDSVNSKKRIEAITENIKNAELGIITEESDKQLDDMNDIMNTRMPKVGDYED